MLKKPCDEVVLVCSREKYRGLAESSGGWEAMPLEVFTLAGAWSPSVQRRLVSEEPTGALSGTVTW